MKESKTLGATGGRRRHLRPEERAQVLARWSEGECSAAEIARQTGESRASLSRWKRLAVTGGAAMRGSALVEVPAPVGGAGVAEVMTRSGSVRLFAPASPVWAAELVRELNRATQC